jgi:hypothetical protein
MQNKLIFNSIPNLIKSKKFLPVDARVEKNFAGYDSKLLFKKNLEIMPPDWYYRNKTITYTRNKQGYRTQEFKKIDWSNSIVIFGCSNVFGIGVDDNETLSYQLSNILKVPVINMGVEGSSINYSLHNSVILKHFYPKPLAVVNMWTHYSRTVYYYKRYLENCGDWNPGNFYFSAWSKDDSHAASYAIIASMTSKIFWQDTKYYESSFFPDTSKLLNCDLYRIQDHARDLLHPGIKTLKLTAEQIANKLNI